MLSVLAVPGVLAACAREDAVAFTRVPGIGKKLAHRIAMELPDRLRKVAVELSPAVGFMAFPVLLILYLVWRVIAERLKNREDDYYDHIEK